MNPQHAEYPIFKSKASRDVYLDKLIANGYQVKAKMIHAVVTETRFDNGVPLPDTEYGEVLYTVEDIDLRKGE